MTLQPLLHNETVILRAPTQSWSARDGSIGSAAIHGIWFSDVRVISALNLAIGGEHGEPIATIEIGADAVTFVALARHLDDASPDPRVRVEQARRVSIHGVTETITIESTLTESISTPVTVFLASDLAEMDRVKAGLDGETVDFTVEDGAVSWTNGVVSAILAATGARIETTDAGLTLTWDVTVPAHGASTVGWWVAGLVAFAVVDGVAASAPWSVPTVASGDDRLARWVARALEDLDALRLTTPKAPGEFLAAGSPWFFTLFGRDSIWAARFLLPLGTALAADTLRVLAGLQGSENVGDTAEQPGKIMHELRRGTLELPGEGVTLPPLYYGTVDATPLWVCLLHDAWRWGMPVEEVESLLPNLERALAWMRDYGDSDGDGLLEYIDETGHGLSNQGWKDSGDSVQWRSGELAQGPIALCEVQAYAFEAATHGADLLEAFGRDGSEWRTWADRLRTEFADRFWIDDPDGAYPAIALDADKRPVDTVTSNIGHLLGTGLLTREEAALVAARLVSPQMDSGFGLRTMSTDAAGYWPLSYHGGSVWTHDTAIAIAGLTREGFPGEAGVLVRGLLAAASGFDYRMPELHSGDSFAAPVPYPAACRPQAWSAAAAVSVLGSVLGARPSDDGTAMTFAPGALGTSVSVQGLRFAGDPVSVSVATDGSVDLS